MSQLNGIRYVLEKLRVKVRQKHLDLMAKGTTPQVGDVKTPQFWANLQKFADQLALMMRNLGSMAQSLEAQAEGARFAPLAYRYSARQSVRDRQRNVQNVMDLALEIAGDLQDLYGRGQKPTEADMIKGIEKIMKELGKQIDSAQLQATVKHLTSEPGFHGHAQSAPSLGGLASLPVLVMAIIFMIRRKSRERQKQDA
jgi:hypothetical protein